MGNWEANIYVNGKMQSSVKVNNSTPLNDIRDSINLGFYNHDLHFISRKGGFIENEDNFTAKDVYQDDKNGGYKINLMDRKYFDEYFEAERDEMVNLYFNMFPDKAIKYDKNMTLERIREIGDYNLNVNDIFFLSKQNIKIDNLDEIKAKDIIKITPRGKRIDLVDSNYYKKFQVIEHLKELEKSDNFDWLEQTIFFRKVRDLCGEEVTTAIIDELYEKRRNGNDIKNKEYIQKFLDLLIEDNKNNLFDSTRTHF